MLNVDHNAKKHDIELAYRSIIKYVHPDRTGNQLTSGITDVLGIARDVCLESIVDERPLTRRMDNPVIVKNPFDFPFAMSADILDNIMNDPPKRGTLHREHREFKNGKWSASSETFVDGVRVRQHHT